MEHSPAQSRRTVLRIATGLGAASLVAISTGRALAAKASKIAVNYQDVPKGSQTCSNCVLFEVPNQCNSVEGEVNGNGWCRIWVEKTLT
jgi:hypothetical protein